GWRRRPAFPARRSPARASPRRRAARRKPAGPPKCEGSLPVSCPQAGVSAAPRQRSRAAAPLLETPDHPRRARELGVGTHEMPKRQGGHAPMISQSNPGHRPSTPASAALKLSLLLAGLAFATSARAECSRDTLRTLTDAYVEAQAAGNPALLPVAAGGTPGASDTARDIAGAIRARAPSVDCTRSHHDHSR